MASRGGGIRIGGGTSPLEYPGLGVQYSVGDGVGIGTERALKEW